MPDDYLPLLQSYFASAFPEREAPLVTDLISLNAGWESEVYSFTATWGPPGQRVREELILRIYPGSDVYDLLLQRTGLPIQEVEAFLKASL